jgi:AraC-like DNA-binding protein
MTSGGYQRFDTPGIAAGDRFEYWRGWYSRAVDAPMQLEPVDTRPHVFDASAEVLAVGEIDIVEYRFGPAIGRWTREAIEPSDRLRLVMLASAPDATGCWHQREQSLADGTAILLGRTAGRWRAPHGLRGIQVNAPREAIPVTDAQLEAFNDQRRLRHNPAFARIVRPTLLGLAGHLNSLGGADLPELSCLWVSLLTMLTRSLAGEDTNATDCAQARLLQARRYIRANLADPVLSPTTIADALHVSRSTLYATLPSNADGITAEIRRQRLQRAHTILSNPSNSQPIADIAAAVGIPNAARFSRIFHHQYGLTPRELRAHQQTNGHYRPPTSGIVPDATAAAGAIEPSESVAADDDHSCDGLERQGGPLATGPTVSATGHRPRPAAAHAPVAGRAQRRSLRQPDRRTATPRTLALASARDENER